MGVAVCVCVWRGNAEWCSGAAYETGTAMVSSMVRALVAGVTCTGIGARKAVATVRSCSMIVRGVRGDGDG